MGESTPIEPGGELRWNGITRRWVVIAPSRARRPVETEAHDAIAPAAETLPSSAPRASEAVPPNDHLQHDPSCPFCTGNEEDVPPIAWELAGPDPAGWRVRAIPNRFPAFSAPAEQVPHLPARPAEGYQEVLVESPRHLDDLCEMDRAQLEGVVEGYRRRYSEICDRPGITRVSLFRNRGPRAGTSLRHPHAQIVATVLDPPELQDRDRALRTLREEAQGVCPLCEPGSFEPRFEARSVHEGPHFRAWVPWAAAAPFEVWIAPRRHSGDFRAVGGAESGALARLLGGIARVYRDAAGDPDYNLLLHSVGPLDPDPNPLHWWIRLRPRVGTEAGLELLTQLFVNSSSPEADAGILRDALRNTSLGRE